MAHLAQDEGLLHSLPERLACTAPPAAEVMGVPLEEVSNEDRRRARPSTSA